MKHPLRIAAFLLALSGIAGCVNGEFQSNPLLDIALKRVGLGQEEAAPQPEAGPAKGPPLIVGYDAARIAMPFEEQRGQAKHYASADGVEISMVNGFATRVIGIGTDLEGMFLPADSIYTGDFVASARAGQSGERIVEYWEKGRMRRDNYNCRLAIAPLEGDTEIIDETCKRYFDDYAFANRYWVKEDRVVCSRQWIHPDMDVLQLFRTARQAVSIDLRTGNC